ncbi:MAG TPA: 4-hydroxy-3-methylbut-2-enyl diphosphate reductase, partial [Acidimicrobiales bacterium]|nr:4-hydroxy-3-methylbut-2-enyl diphosphate reductase [Acidimicrobiales bacterium]
VAVGGDVTLTGMGRAKATAAGARLGASPPSQAVALVGVAGGLDPDLRVGQLVVATEVRSADGRIVRPLPGAERIAHDLRQRGIDVRTGPIVSSPRLVRTALRAELASTGALAVDMESAWLVDQLPDRPVAVVRSISDTADRGMVLGGMRALATLMQVRPSLEVWAGALGRRHVVLAAPRSFCAGVERAIEIVERALDRFGAPVYVRRQIVHNSHVVADLKSKGAIFVEELDDVPAHAVVVLAAHGVSPKVREDAARRDDLSVIDATCPLVTKVHHEARRFAAHDYQIVLIGHEGHEEIAGTLGEAPMALVERPEDVAALDIDPGAEVAYLTQTTLATDETAEIVAALRDRFPDLHGPNSNDICYATQNRQDAVRGMVDRCDLLLVVGSANSSNTARLVEVARREGCRAQLIEDETQLRLSWFDGVATVGITAGASAPEFLVQRVIDSLSDLGPVAVTEQRTTDESAHFSLPQAVR